MGRLVTWDRPPTWAQFVPELPMEGFEAGDEIQLENRQAPGTDGALAASTDRSAIRARTSRSRAAVAGQIPRAAPVRVHRLAATGRALPDCPTYCRRDRHSPADCAP